jgi:hypothetical protein
MMGGQVLAFARQNALFLVVLALLVVAFLALRTRGSTFGSLSEFDALISSGQPVVAEFYSNT